MLELESAASPSGEPPSLSERVLIVEDDRATRLGLTELVRSWGYVAESAADGEEALQRITTFRPGIIVSDVVMPRMDGLALLKALRDQMQLAGDSTYLFPSEIAVGHQTTFKTVWRLTLRRAKVPYFRIYDLRSTYATRLSAGGVADEWVTQLLRQGDAKVFKK